MRYFLSLLLVVLALIDARAQLFMRAYAPLGATFNPPNFYAPASAAAVTPTGYLLADYYGIVCALDPYGEPLACHRLRRASSQAGIGLYLTHVESDGADAFYYASLANDTMIVLKSNGAASITWQAGIVGANTGEQLLPTGDGGCMLLYRIGNAGSQRAALVRYGANGAVIWRKAYRIPGNNSNFMAYGLAHTADGGFLICGQFNSASTSRAFVCRLNANGSVSWAREIGPGNNNDDEAMAVTELPNGNIRVAIRSPQTGMALSMVDLSGTGGFLSSWGYQAPTLGAGPLRFAADGSAYATGNYSQVYRIAPDGSVVFAQNHEGPPGTSMTPQALLPKADGTQVLLGNYYTNPFSNSISALYASGPLGVLPSPYSSPYSINQVAYTATLSAISPSDSALTGGHTPQLIFQSEPLWADTMFAVPTGVNDQDPVPFDLQIRPNPVSDQLTIGADGNIGFRSVEVFDPSGARVLSLQGNLRTPYSIDLRSLSSGSYILQVEGPGGRVSQSFLKN